MKLLFIGNSVIDTIHSNHGTVVQPGGMFYTASAALALKNKHEEFFLLTGLDKEHYELFEPIYSKLNLEYSIEMESPKVELFIVEHGERIEKYHSKINNLSVDKIIEDNFDGIFINMITGTDIELEDLKRLRAKSDAIIYMDVHTLARGFNEKGVREFRIIPHFSDWASCVDFIQVNEHEIFTLSPKKNIDSIAQDVLNCGVKSILLTKGELGATIISSSSGKLIKEDIPAIKINAVNKVGCGDIFGTTFFCYVIRSLNVSNSASVAVTAGGLMASYSSPEMIGNLRKDLSLYYA